MKTSATNRKIRILLTAIRDGMLVPRPEFQRRLVWSNKHKVAFLETVLRNYPFPEIYIAAGEVNPDTGEGTEMLVDGQQRITTLQQYFTGSTDLRLGTQVRPYANLTKDEKVEFLEYEVVIRDLGNKSIEEIKEIFKRINSTKYSLNAMEIHNARFDGAFKRFGEKISQHNFFEQNRVFKANEIRRMGDVNFALTFIITIMSTYFNRDTELEMYLDKYNDEFEMEEEVRHQIEQVFLFIDKFKLGQSSRAWKKADLLTLLVEAHRLLLKEKLEIEPDKTAMQLNDFYGQVDKAASDTDVAPKVKEYYNAALQATNDRRSRILRGDILRQVLKGNGPN